MMVSGDEPSALLLTRPHTWRPLAKKALPAGKAPRAGTKPYLVWQRRGDGPRLGGHDSQRRRGGILGFGSKVEEWQLLVHVRCYPNVQCRLT